MTRYLGGRVGTRLIGLLIVGLSLAGAACFTASPATAADVHSPGILTVQTAPAIPGVRIKVDGSTAVTGPTGMAQVPVRNFVHLERRFAIPWTRVSPRLKVAADRTIGSFSSGASGRPVVVGLRSRRLVRLSFTDLQGAPVSHGRITRVEMHDNDGQIVWLRGSRIDKPIWLPASRTRQDRGRLRVKPLTWNIMQVVVDGSNVVISGQQTFKPRRTPDWKVELRFYRVRVVGRDLFFGALSGQAVSFKSDDGTMFHRPLLDGRADLTSVPSGAYQVHVLGPGLSFTRPVTVTKDQVLEIQVLTPLDLGLVAAVLFFFAVSLIVIGRRATFARLARRLFGASRQQTWTLFQAERRLSRVGRQRMWTLLPVLRRLLLVARQRAWVLLQMLRRLLLAARHRAWAFVQLLRGLPVANRQRTWAFAAVILIVTTLPMLLQSAGHAATPPQVAAPQHAAAPQRPCHGCRATPAFAYYYIWYHPTSWQRAKTDYPLLGAYSSDDALVMRRQVEIAKKAGLTGFIVSWKSTSDLNRRLATLVRICRSEHFKLEVVYEGLTFHRHTLPPQRVATDLSYFAQTYGTNPVFNTFGRPAVILTGSEDYSLAAIRSIRAATQGKLLLLASAKSVAAYQRTASLTDGDAYYWSSQSPYLLSYASKLRDMGRAVHRDHGLWFPPATAAFDARLIGGHRIVPPNGGRTLRQSIAVARTASPDALAVISWNEYSENSQVEPSENRGRTELAALASELGGTVAPFSEFHRVAPLYQVTPRNTGLSGVGALSLLLLAFAVLGMTMALLRARRRGRADAERVEREAREEAAARKREGHVTAGHSHHPD